MLKPQNACCPECTEPISFRKFVVLNNLSATHCDKCKTRMEIANRNANAVIAGVSGCLSAASIVVCSYLGYRDYQSLIGGMLVGTAIATLIIVFICWYVYTHSKLSRLHTEYRLWSEAPRKKESSLVKESLDWIASTGTATAN
ncbi:hypothetical protein [Sediminibacterium soli]|uniref:hypothetical protein n=1 Tax=Sediminibacterium soli TaxID=2698829 RepID=UPI00137B587E|nr:hypothetical protein [Sediminibacterium soli]NCI45498.1 hypothetical protein [Sediminibacterium soli]